MALERAVDARQFLERPRHRLFHRRLVGAGLGAGGFRDLLRGTDAGDHVLALGVDQEFAVERSLAGRRIAREGDAGGRGLAHIAEHHGLDIDRGAPAFRNVVQAAIGNGALVHPRAEHGADCAPELAVRVLRERFAVLLLETRLVAPHQIAPIVGRKLGIERVAVAVLVVVENLLEVVVLDPEHDVRIHRNEATIGVVGEAPIAGIARQRLRRHVVESEIEHRVHHAGHGCAPARAHRDQQRIAAIAEGPAGDAADLRKRGVDLRMQLVGIALVVGVELGADRGRDGEAGRHRQAEIGHLGEARALAAEQVAHVGAALGLAVAEAVDPPRLGGLGRFGGFGRFGGRLRALARGGSLAARRRLARGRRAGGFFRRSSTARACFDHGTTDVTAPGP